MIKCALRNRAIDPQQEWLRHAATCSPEELMAELNTTSEGLRNSADIDSSREFYGANTLGKTERKILPLRVLSSFADPFTYILVVIAAVVMVARFWTQERFGRTLNRRREDLCFEIWVHAGKSRLPSSPNRSPVKHE